MADELDAIEEARRQAELAAQQTAQSATNVRAADYAQSPSQVISGAAGGPSTAAMNRPQSEWGTPAPASDYAQRGLPTSAEGLTTSDTPGTSKDNPLQGAPLSPQEQAFWAANPNGAVQDQTSGNLIGLGDQRIEGHKYSDTNYPAVASGVGAAPPGTPGLDSRVFNPSSGTWEDQGVPRRAPVPDFVNIPEVNPALIAQRQQIQNEIATTRNQLGTASSYKFKGQPSQREILTQKLGTLTEANNSLGLEHYRQSEEQRKASDKNTEYQTKYLTNQDVMSANKEISQIQATPGSADYKRQYFQIVNEKYPKAMDDPIFKAASERTALSHDERSAARERAVSAGYDVQDTGIGQNGVSQKFVAPAAVSQQQAITKATQKKIGEDFAKSGLTPEQFSQRGAVVGTDKEGKQVPNADATHMKVDIGGHHTLMPIETFNRLNGAYPAANQNPAAQGQQAAQPAAAPQGTRVVGGKTYAWNGQRWEPQ